MIDSYEFGRIVIDGQVVTSDVIIYPDRVDAGWWRKEGHKLQVEDIESVLLAEPDVLIVGTGAYDRMRVSPEAAKVIEEAGIRLIAEPTEQACRQYNDLAKSVAVVAALHLTC